MQGDFINKMSAITTVKCADLDRFMNVFKSYISQELYESLCINKDTTASINIGLGTLIISVESDSIEYKFIPSKSLESIVVDTAVNGNSKLIDDLNSALTNKLLNAYKDFI